MFTSKIVEKEKGNKSNLIVGLIALPIGIILTINFLEDLGFVCFFILGLGVVEIIYYYIRLFMFNSKLKKLDIGLVNELDIELNSNDVKYYEKLHVALTKNYLFAFTTSTDISFNAPFGIVKYDDIVWMYVHTDTINGVSTNQIVIVDKDNNTIKFAKKEVVTKNHRSLYNELIEDIKSRNENMIFGYGNEQKQEAKKRLM